MSDVKDNLRSIPTTKSLETVEAEAMLAALLCLEGLTKSKQTELAFQASATLLQHVREKEGMALHRLEQKNIDDERSAELRAEKENSDAERLKDQESKRLLIDNIMLIAPPIINKLIERDNAPRAVGAVAPAPSRHDAWEQFLGSLSPVQQVAFDTFSNALTPDQVTMFYALLET